MCVEGIVTNDASIYDLLIQVNIYSNGAGGSIGTLVMKWAMAGLERNCPVCGNLAVRRYFRVRQVQAHLQTNPVTDIVLQMQLHHRTSRPLVIDMS